MNEPVRIVADWLAGTTSGSTSVAAIRGLADFPKDSADSLPPAVNLYDSTRQGFAARRVFPKETNAAAAYPMIVTMLGGLNYETQRHRQDAGTAIQVGEATLFIFVATRLQDSDEGLEDVGYLTRAVLGSLYLLNAPAQLAKRTRNGFALALCTALRVELFRLEKEDNFVANLITAIYTTHETTPD